MATTTADDKEKLQLDEEAPDTLTLDEAAPDEEGTEEEQPQKPENLTEYYERQKREQPTSTWEKVKRAVNPLGGFSAPSEILGAAGQSLKEQGEIAQTENLKAVARGEKPSGAKAQLLDLAGRGVGMAGGLINPQNIAIGAGAVVAPEIVGPGLIAHGLYGAAKPAYKLATTGDISPEEAEQGLGSLAEAAGGGATLGEIPKMGGVRKTLTGKTFRKAVLGTPWTEAGRLQAAAGQAMTVQRPSIEEVNYAQNVKDAIPDLQIAAQDAEAAGFKPQTPRDEVGILSKRIKQIESPVDYALRGPQAPQTLFGPADYQNLVAQAIDQKLAASGQKLTPEEKLAGKKAVMDYIGNDPKRLRDMEDHRIRLNDDADDYYKSKPADQRQMNRSEAEAISQRAAADKIRDILYGERPSAANPQPLPGQLERAGITTVNQAGRQLPIRDLRLRVGRLIDIKEHFEDAITRAENTGDWSIFGKGGIAGRGPSLAAGGLGAFFAGPLGALGAFLIPEGLKALRDYRVSTNPNLNIQKMHRNLVESSRPDLAQVHTGPPMPGPPLLPPPAPPATTAGYNAGPSGPVRGGRWTTPAGLIPGPNVGLLPAPGGLAPRGVPAPPPGTAEIAHPEIFSQPPPGVPAPTQTYREPATGRMARGFTGENPPRVVGQTAEGGPIRETLPPIEAARKVVPPGAPEPPGLTPFMQDLVRKAGGRIDAQMAEKAYNEARARGFNITPNEFLGRLRAIAEGRTPPPTTETAAPAPAPAGEIGGAPEGEISAAPKKKGPPTLGELLRGEEGTLDLGRLAGQEEEPSEIESLTPAAALHQGDTFVDDRNEPRRITEITEDGTIKTADGTLRNYPEGEIQHMGEINSPQAQIARGGRFHPEGEQVEGEKPKSKFTPISEDEPDIVSAKRGSPSNVDIEKGTWFLNDDGSWIGSPNRETSPYPKHEQVADFIDEDKNPIRMGDSNAFDLTGPFGGGNPPTEQQISEMARIFKQSGQDKVFWELPNGGGEGSFSDFRRAIQGGFTPEVAATTVHPKGSTVELMTNPLDTTRGKYEAGTPTIGLLDRFNKFTRGFLGKLVWEKGIDPQKVANRVEPLLEDEARWQLARDNSGSTWYKDQMGEHDRIAGEMRPVLQNPTKLSIFKFGEAILSAGQKPYGNFKGIIRAFDHYAKTGKWSYYNPESVERIPIEDTKVKALLEGMKGKDKPKSVWMEDLKVGDRIVDEEGTHKNIVAIRGDKLITAKSWGPRAMKAYGTAFDMLNQLIKEKGEEGASQWLLSEHPVSELRQYNKNVPGKMTDTAHGAMILGEKRGPFALNLHGMEAPFTADMWVARTWNRWMGTLDFSKTAEEDSGEIYSDAPRNKSERALMKASFERVANKLGISTSALQAVMWYYEQALYTAHGVPKESWSFSDAAQRAFDEERGIETRTKSGKVVKKRSP